MERREEAFAYASERESFKSFTVKLLFFIHRRKEMVSFFDPVWMKWIAIRVATAGTIFRQAL